MTMIPETKVSGRYKGTFIPRETGEYRFYFHVKTANGEDLKSAGDYLVVDKSPESEPNPMAEGKLQSLARQTGGTYWRYNEVSSISDINLTKNLNYTEEISGLTESWLYLLLIIAFLLPDWILRRRIGLR